VGAQAQKNRSIVDVGRFLSLYRPHGDFQFVGKFLGGQVAARLQQHEQGEESVGAHGNPFPGDSPAIIDLERREVDIILPKIPDSRCQE
jgi:hypothetical protein